MTEFATYEAAIEFFGAMARVAFNDFRGDVWHRCGEHWWNVDTGATVQADDGIGYPLFPGTDCPIRGVFCLR